MPEKRVHDPAVGFRFQVSARSGNVEAGFSKVSGLRDESEVVEYREGTDPLVKTKLQGIRTFPVLTLERGLMTDANGLLDWRQAAILCARGFRSDTLIVVYNCDRVPARSVLFADSWPSALQMGDLDAGASEVNIETVELVHEGQVANTLFVRGGLPLRTARGGV